MITYLFEYDASGTIGRTIMYEGENPPAQQAGPDLAFLVVNLNGDEDQAARDRLMTARANPGRFQVVEGALVER